MICKIKLFRIVIKSEVFPMNHSHKRIIFVHLLDRIRKELQTLILEVVQEIRLGLEIHVEANQEVIYLLGEQIIALVVKE